MNLQPSDEQILLRDTIRRLLADRIDLTAMGAGPSPQQVWRELADLGVLSLMVPEDAGGMDAAPQDAMIVAEELGRAIAITPFAEAILGAVDIVARHGDAAQIARWVAPAVAGDLKLALATGDVALREGNIHGTCAFVRWAADADAYVILVDDAACIVSRDTPGVTLVAGRLADGTSAPTLHFDACPGDVVALPAPAVAEQLALVQLGYVAEMVGTMATLFEQTVDYARDRRQFGAAIGTFQVVQHKLARMYVSLEQARSILLKAGVAPRGAPGFVRGVYAAKAYVAHAAQGLAEEAVQLHGGMGVTDELPVGRGLRRILVLARLYGSAEDARLNLAA